LLRDILRQKDPQIAAVIDVLVETSADILTLQGFDYDLENASLQPLPTLAVTRPLIWTGTAN
jgi:hypothetical protein